MSTAASTIRIVAAVVRDARGHCLLVRKRGATCFQQPGGKPDPADRDALATLARELREELGCDLVEGTARWLCQGLAPAANEAGCWVEAEVYTVQLQGEPRPCAEIEELCWVDPAAPDALPIATLSREQILPRLCGQRIGRDDG